MNFDDMSDRLRRAPNFEQGVEASEGEIVGAESILGKFPQQYRQFLSEFGWVHFRHYDINGLGADESDPEYSVVITTLSERESLGLPSDLIAISNDGGGNLSCFQVAPDNQVPDEAVYILYHENGDFIRAADSLIDYIVDRLE